MKKTPLPAVISDSPVEQWRKKLPYGTGTWDGFAAVYGKLSLYAEHMGREPHFHLSDLHIETMAIMGCGHEETMKAHLWHLRDRFPDLEFANKEKENEKQSD